MLNETDRRFYFIKYKAKCLMKKIISRLLTCLTLFRAKSDTNTGGNNALFELSTRRPNPRTNNDTIKDGKTDKPLFGPKAWNLYKSTLLHIRKGCLSDIPGLSYYVQVDEDSHGIPIFRCLRGTNALEGFHQKVRQIIRGFNISPRFVVALMSEFMHRWNHDCDIRILGLPRRYNHYYDGWEMEDDIEATWDWAELAEPPHPEVECTKDFAPTGEEFGLLATVNARNGMNSNDLDEEIEKIVDAIKDGSWEQGDKSDDLDLSSLQLHELTASAAWVAEKFGRKRGIKGVKTEAEKNFFQNNWTSFQTGTADMDQTVEADNYSIVQWGQFARFWNSLLKEEDDGNRPHTDMTYKTAPMLMERRVQHCLYFTSDFTGQQEYAKGTSRSEARNIGSNAGFPHSD